MSDGLAETSPDGGVDPRAVLTALASAVYQWDIAADRISWGANAAAVFGLDAMTKFEDGAAWRKLLSSRSPSGREDAVTGSGLVDEGAGVPFQTRYEIVLPRGPVVVEDQGRWFAGVDGKPGHARGIVRVIDRSAFAASGPVYDIGASARVDLLRRIETAIEAARKDARPLALLVGCVRDYRAIDARHGSEDADAVVGVILKRLQNCVRQTDFLVCYASNRFALLLGRCPKGELEGAALRLSGIVCDDLVSIETGAFSASISWGGLSDLDGAREARQVLRRCEDAMQQAATRGVDYVAYVPDRRRDSRRVTEQAIAEDVIHALNERRILIARQPIVGARDRRVRFEEALLRMRREDGEIVAAGAIVPLFEKLGRIDLLDHRVLELSIDALVADPDARLSVNVSTKTLLNDAWMTTLSSALIGRADLADRLIVEMTESQAIDDVETTRKIFSRLKAMGLRTAIDDFGAGYTSFRHLRGFDVDILKIDGAFVQNIGRSADDSFFVRTLIDLAQHLGMETVAEWVRDEESARKLLDWGVTCLQGDAIGPAKIIEPAPAMRAAKAA